MASARRRRLTADPDPFRVPGAALMTFSQAETDRHLADMAKSDWYGDEGALEWQACLHPSDREAPAYET